MAVLLLNVTYEPLRVISDQRAIVLLVQDKAEMVVADAHRKVRSATTEIAYPSVIRLKYFVKVPYKATLPLTRQAVLTRDNHECQFAHCTRKGTTIDHVHPRSKGGKHEWTNVVAACSKCNTKKAAYTLEQMNWKLKRVPVPPHGSKWLLIGLRPQPEWLPYLHGL